MTGPVTDDDEAYLGLPGLLTAEQTAAVLARRDSDLRRRVDAAARSHQVGGPDLFSTEAAVLGRTFGRTRRLAGGGRTAS